MKKARCLLSLLLCVLLVCFPGAAQETPDFCEEYAALNGAPTPDGLHRYAAVELGAEVPFTYAGIEEVAALLEGGTGVLYLGFPECPWCRCLLPALYDACLRAGQTAGVTCFNAQPLRDELSLAADGSVQVEKEAAPAYETLLGLLYDHLTPYEGLGDESIRRIYFPTTVFVRDGEITSVHIGTLDEQEDPYVLSDAQYEALVTTLTAQLDAIG